MAKYKPCNEDQLVMLPISLPANWSRAHLRPPITSHRYLPVPVDTQPPNLIDAMKTKIE